MHMHSVYSLNVDTKIYTSLKLLENITVLEYCIKMTSDKLSIKSLLFTKALPNYITPVATRGHKVYTCTDCGDKYLLESSLQTHIERKSLKITYECKLCGDTRIFYNRCSLLSHIRSHDFKTATISVNDLKIEPLPWEQFKIQPASPNNNSLASTAENISKIIELPNNSLQDSQHLCYECKSYIGVTFVLYKDRASHYMQVSSNITSYSCPVCLFTLPTICGLKAHLRIHLEQPPYFCPECGIHLPTKCGVYPYNHDCEGFKIIRATTRAKCFKNNCLILHPSDYRDHIKRHIGKIYACIVCTDSWQDLPFQHNCNSNYDTSQIVKYLQCPLCSYKGIYKTKINRHINNHFKSFSNILRNLVYPCRLCNDVYDQVPRLLIHQIEQHAASRSIIESIISNPKDPITSKYKVVKRCEKCNRTITYRCPYDYINVLPNKCPYKCCSYIKCFVCKNTMPANWDFIKKHFRLQHKQHNCVDVKVNLVKLNLSPNVRHRIKVLKNSLSTKNALQCDIINGTVQSSEKRLLDRYRCSICELCFNNSEGLERHIVSHRDLNMAYQCLECGKCFAVKPSFSTHLILEHKIADVEEYISKKCCFNELAFNKNQWNTVCIDQGPVEANQCKICREQFVDSHALEKHFRVHGMAFLMEKSIKHGSSY